MVTKQKSKFLSMSFAFLVGFSVMFCSISQLGATDWILYGAANNGPDRPSTLYTIDTSTGMKTKVGRIGFERCSAMDFDVSSGILYATCERCDGSDTNVLISIDTDTGAGTEVGPTGVESLDGLFQGSDTAPDISFRNSDNTLFAYTFPGDGLATIDLSTGAMTQLGWPSGQSGLVTLGGGFGLAFSPLDVLFLAVNDVLMTLDHTTSAATFASSIGFSGDESRINGMDFQPETGTLFASVKSGFFTGATSTLATVDTTTGDVTTIGPTVAKLDALAFVFSPLEFSDFTLKKAMVRFKHIPNNDRFVVRGKFVLGGDSEGINPVDDNVTVNVGTSTIAIPPGSFVEHPAGTGRFRFIGPINGAYVRMKIRWIDDNTFHFRIMVNGVDLTGTANPVLVRLVVGDDIGQSSVRLKGELSKHKHNH